MLGLIGGALQGGAEAAQDNAKTRIKKMHDEAMTKMRQEFQRSERVAGQKFTANQGEIDRSFRAGESEADRAQRLRLAEMREQGANSRAAMNRQPQPQWQILPDGEGGFTQYDPNTNTTRPVPDGVDFGNTGKLDPRQQLIVEDLQSRREILSDQLTGDILDPETQKELQRDLDTVNARINRYLNPAGSGNVDVELDAALGDSENQSGQNTGGSGLINDGMNRDGENSQEDARATLENREQQQQQAEAATAEVTSTRQAVGSAKDVATNLQNLRDYSGMSMGGQSEEWRNSQQRLMQEGRQKLAELMEIYNSTSDPDLRSLTMEGMNELRSAGVPLPQE